MPITWKKLTWKTIHTVYSTIRYSHWRRRRQTITSWQIVVVQLLSRVWLFVTPWTEARQDSLSFTISWSLLKLMSTESVMPSNHLFLCHSLLLLPSIFPSIYLLFYHSLILSFYLSTYLSITYLSTNLSIYLFTSLSIYLPIYLIQSFKSSKSCHLSQRMDLEGFMLKEVR